MRNAQGGTNKWCPKCKDIRVVKSIPPASIIWKPDQRVCEWQYDDLSYFRRGQECQTCWKRWLSAELPEDFVHELATLRNEVRDLRKAAEAQTEEPEHGNLRLVSGD